MKTKKNKINYKEKDLLSRQVNIHIAYIVVIAVVAVAVYILADAYFADEKQTEQKQEYGQKSVQACEGLAVCNVRVVEQTVIGQASDNSERTLVDIEWDATKQPANYYVMQYKQSATTEWQNCGVECFVGQSNNKVQITLSRATTYNFQVQACSGQDCTNKGEWSKPLTFTTE